MNPVCLLIISQEFMRTKAESLLLFAICFIRFSLIQSFILSSPVGPNPFSPPVPDLSLFSEVITSLVHLLSIYCVLSTLLGPRLPKTDKTPFQPMENLFGKMGSKLAF